MDSTILLLISGGYLLGSVSSAILICRLVGLGDPRALGSGNPGATNVLRLGGKPLALATLVGDLAKGAVPVLLAIYMEQPRWVAAAAGTAAFLGHLFPVFFNFKGGKGVATFFGIIWALDWQLGLYATVCWLVTAWTFRYSSLAALVTAITVPIYAAFFFKPLFVFLCIIGLVMIYRHRRNIQNIRLGIESKLGSRTPVESGET